jgi:hypothetical protein
MEYAESIIMVFDYFAAAIIMAVPVLVVLDKAFDFLWGGAKRRNVSYVYYDVQKKSNNPYLSEKATVTMYMPDRGICHTVAIESDEDREDLACLVKNMASSRNDVYFVSYDGAGNKAVYLKSLIPPFETDDIRTIDIKKLFYLTHPTVPNVTYGKIVSRYQLLSSMPTTNPGSEMHLQFFNIFHEIMQEWDAKKMFDARSVQDLYYSLAI